MSSEPLSSKGGIGEIQLDVATVTWEWPTVLQKPESPSLAVPSSVSQMFAGFRSRRMMPWAGACSSDRRTAAEGDFDQVSPRRLGRYICGVPKLHPYLHRLSSEPLVFVM